jgi:hypothetical protein
VDTKFERTYKKISEIVIDRSTSLTLIEGRKNQEIIDKYDDLSKRFAGNFRLARPEKILKEDGSVVISYSIPYTRDGFSEVSIAEFKDKAKSLVNNEINEIVKHSKINSESADERQSARILRAFKLPEKFESSGEEFLIRIKDVYYLIGWGVEGNQKPIIKPIAPSQNPIQRFEVNNLENGDVSIKVILSSKGDQPGDFHYQWYLDDSEVTGPQSDELLIRKAELDDYEGDVTVRVVADHHADSQKEGEFEHVVSINKAYDPVKPIPYEPGVSELEEELKEESEGETTVDYYLAVDQKMKWNRIELKAQVIPSPLTVDYFWSSNDQELSESSICTLKNEDFGSSNYKTCKVTAKIQSENTSQVLDKSVDLELKWWQRKDVHRAFLWILLILALILLLYWFLGNKDRAGSNTETTNTEQTLNQPTNGGLSGSGGSPSSSGPPGPSGNGGPPDGSGSGNIGSPNPSSTPLSQLGSYPSQPLDQPTQDFLQEQGDTTTDEIIPDDPNSASENPTRVGEVWKYVTENGDIFILRMGETDYYLDFKPKPGSMQNPNTKTSAPQQVSKPRP